MRDTVRAALERGEAPEAVAARHGLELADGVVLLPGWVADDGHCRVEFPDAEVAEEAAEEYVGGGSWGDGTKTVWIPVAAWREGLRAVPVECAWCHADATAHDEAGDPACVEHARPTDPNVKLLEPLTQVEVVEFDRETFTIASDPDEPPCVDGEDHNWQTPHEIVGGIESNPGVWGSGGGVRIKEVCVRCGCLCVTDTWGQDLETGEQGLRSISYDMTSSLLAEYLTGLDVGVLDQEVVAKGDGWSVFLARSPATPHVAVVVEEEHGCDVDWFLDEDLARAQAQVDADNLRAAKEDTE